MSLNLTMIGTGYVGLVTGVCFAKLGHNVICADIDPNKIDKLNQGISPIYEDGLSQMLLDQAVLSRIRYSTDTEASVKAADAVFLCVGTPSDKDTGEADLSYVYAAAKSIIPHMKTGSVIVNKSTVPVGTQRNIARLVDLLRPENDLHVVSNPEFLREGTAVFDFLNPDRIVIGCDHQAATHVMQQIYAPLTQQGTPLLITKPQTSELIKYASNAFLATKIAFINELADLAETVGADIGDIAHGMGLDQRISPHFLNAGPGYGGSCFPKDTLAITHTAKQYGHTLNIIQAVIASNQRRKTGLAERIKAAFDGNKISGKTIAVWGLAFKAGTDDMRDSPALDLIPALVGDGAQLQVFDPAAMDTARQSFADIQSKITWAADQQAALQNADALCIATEWPAFKNVDWDKLPPVIIDFRNMLCPSEAAKHGKIYISIGRAPVTIKACDDKRACA